MSNTRHIDVINDFTLPQRVPINLRSLATQTPVTTSNIPVEIVNEVTPIPVRQAFSKPQQHKKLLEYFYAHTIVCFALIVLAIALVARPLVLDLWPVGASSAANTTVKHSPTYGLNLSINKTALSSWLNTFTSQPASINLGSQTVAVNPNIIRNWVKINSSSKSNTVGIHLDTALVQSSLVSLANRYVSQPVNQVVATRSDGSSEIAVYGKNGNGLANPSSIASQAQQISKNLFSNKGFQINAPLVSTPFKTITPAAFGKLIVVDLNSKKMYVYQNGQIINTFLVTAGKPSTPTPVGEFHIYEKLPIQNMSGFNPDGTPYYQPNVQWVNYFDGSDAIHGNYWRPLSYFGNINSSHGCVGLIDSQAEWVYNWAPIGTTVITTPN